MLDQSTAKTVEALSGYEVSDFLWAKAIGISKMDAVPLTFSHKMSKVVINLVKGEDYEGDIPTEAVVRIHNTVPAAIVDLTTGIITKNDYESTKSITTKKVSDGIYTAIVVPQRLDNKLPLIEGFHTLFMKSCLFHWIYAQNGLYITIILSDTDHYLIFTR